MGSFAVGDVVILPFPFSDQANAKMRPAVVVAALPGDDSILCAISSRRQRLIPSIEIKDKDFKNGSLHHEPSYALPSKLLLAEDGLIRKKVGELDGPITANILEAIRDLFR